jgi:hypothetical protein
MTDVKKTNISDGCAAFQEQLPELLGENQDPSQHPHLLECENCSELVRDLMYIAQQAKLLLPLHDPSPELWNKIEAALPKSSKA